MILYSVFVAYSSDFPDKAAIIDTFHFKLLIFVYKLFLNYVHHFSGCKKNILVL